MDKKILAGVSRVNITPPLGYRLQGHLSRNQPSGKVHDPLYMKVLSISNGSDRVVIITADLLGFSVDTVNMAWKEIKARTGLLPHQVMICASHTHSGPFVLPPPDGKLNENYIPGYTALLAKQAAGAVREAMSCEEKVSLVFGKKEINIGSINRRKKNPDGTIGGPDPDGPADREVSVLSFEKNPGTPHAILFNYGCHPTTVSNKIYDITAEYPGAAQSELERFYPGATALFTNGCSGDVRPALLNEDRTEFRAGDFEDIRRMGRLLAAGTIEAIEDSRRKSINSDIRADKIEGRLIQFPFPLDERLVARDVESLERNFPELVRRLRAGNPPMEHEMKWKEMWKERILKKEDIKAEVEGDIQVFRIGPLSLVAFPGDTMSEIGLKIKKRLPLAVTISNSNRRIGYIPSAQGLKDGGYEACFFFFQGFPGPYAPGMEEALVKRIIELAEK
mgnify:CR=1 FL=1